MKHSSLHDAHSNVVYGLVLYSIFVYDDVSPSLLDAFMAMQLIVPGALENRRQRLCPEANSFARPVVSGKVKAGWALGTPGPLRHFYADAPAAASALQEETGSAHGVGLLKYLYSRH